MGAENSAKTSKRVVGRPFQRGQSSNPGGRPKGLLEFRARCQQFTDDHGLDALIEIASAKRHPDKLAALRFLAEQGYGKAEGFPRLAQRRSRNSRACSREGNSRFTTT